MHLVLCYWQYWHYVADGTSAFGVVPAMFYKARGCKVACMGLHGIVPQACTGVARDCKGLNRPKLQTHRVRVVAQGEPQGK